MALPNTRVVRGSAALSKSIGKYVDDFLYSEGRDTKGAARKVALMTLAMGQSLSLHCASC